MVVGQRLELNSYLTWLKTYSDPNTVCAHKQDKCFPCDKRCKQADEQKLETCKLTIKIVRMVL